MVSAIGNRGERTGTVRLLVAATAALFYSSWSYGERTFARDANSLEALADEVLASFRKQDAKAYAKLAVIEKAGKLVGAFKGAVMTVKTYGIDPASVEEVKRECKTWGDDGGSGECTLMMKGSGYTFVLRIDDSVRKPEGWRMASYVRIRDVVPMTLGLPIEKAYLAACARVDALSLAAKGQPADRYDCLVSMVQEFEACSNAERVLQCYGEMTSWDQRNGCRDLCIRTAAP